MNYLVYQAYRNLDNLHECLYSLYTLAALPDHPKVVIYTDRADYLQQYAPVDLEIRYRSLEDAEINAWQGEARFVHRFKICMLLDLAEQLELRDNILYVDTDVVFKRSPKEIYEGISNARLWMHLNEGNIVGQAKTHRIFKKVSRFMDMGLPSSGAIPRDQDMWNAGVLGFQASDRSLLAEVLALTDQIYQDFVSHVVEQLSFSLVFSRQAERELLAAEAYIYHYWNFKEFRSVLKAFFAKYNEPEVIQQKFAQIDPMRLIQPKLEYERLSFIPKTLRKLSGKWDLPPYEI